MGQHIDIIAIGDTDSMARFRVRQLRVAVLVFFQVRFVYVAILMRIRDKNIRNMENSTFSVSIKLIKP